MHLKVHDRPDGQFELHDADRCAVEGLLFDTRAEADTWVADYAARLTFEFDLMAAGAV